MRILIAPDKFKGSLPAREVAEALRQGFASVWPEAVFDLVPIADGGEGTAQIFLDVLGGEWIEADCHDALDRPVTGRYVWVADRKIAMVEMSEASGLWRLHRDELDPLRASTFGTGELINHAIARGATELLIGLGGSATNDGAAGMAQALGWRFLDARGQEVTPHPAFLSSVTEITPPKDARKGIKITGLCDVTNPLLGPTGATHTYGRQKGASAQELEILERGLAHLADLCRQQLGADFAEVAGAGAAGGFGFGLLTFCGGQLERGFPAISHLLGLEEKMRAADLVVTGEGRLDRQSDHGKAPVELAALARQLGKPAIAFAGSVEGEGHELFTACIPIADGPLTLDESRDRAAELLRRAAARAGRLLALGQKRD